MHCEQVAALQRVPARADRETDFRFATSSVGLHASPRALLALASALILQPDLVLQYLELSNYFQILGSTCCTLYADQPRQVEQLHIPPEDGDGDRVWQQIRVLAAADDFAEQVDGTGAGSEREVEPCRERGDGPIERQPGRRASQIGIAGVTADAGSFGVYALSARAFLMPAYRLLPHRHRSQYRCTQRLSMR